MAQACARLCHQRRHLLNDVGGHGESGESGESGEKLESQITINYHHCCPADLLIVLFTDNVHTFAIINIFAKKYYRYHALKHFSFK